MAQQNWIEKDIWRPLATIASLQQTIEEWGALEYEREQLSPDAPRSFLVPLPIDNSDIWHSPAATTPYKTEHVELKKVAYYKKIYQVCGPESRVLIHSMFVGVSHKTQKLYWQPCEQSEMVIVLSWPQQ